MRRGLFLFLGLAGFVLFAVFAFRGTGIDADELLGRAPAAAPDGATPSSAADSVCAIEAAGVELPAALRETSGIARTSDGSLWTHNDGDEARLYRLNEDGTIAHTVVLEGTRAVDIEDIDASSCPGGAGECLWLADTGDNDGERTEVALLAVPVSQLAGGSARPTRIAFRYPNGPRDAEALAVLSDVAVIVTKGRDTPIEVYRLGGSVLRAAAGAVGAAERIGELGPEPEDSRARVSAAAASPDGAWIALRTNDRLALFRSDDLLGGRAPAFEYDLRPLRESQGEAVELDASGRVWLTSEGERGTPTLARLRCTLPE